MEEKEMKSPDEVINENAEEKQESTDQVINEKTEEVPQAQGPKFETRAVEPLGEDANFPDVVEQKRAALMANFKKAKLVSRIMMAIVVVFVMAAIIFISFEGMGFKIAGYVLAGVALLGMIIFYFTTKNSFPDTSKQYIKEVTDILNSYVFEDKRFSEVATIVDRKIDKAEIELDRVFKDAIDSGSRNSIKGKFNGREFEVSEAALYKAGKDRRTPKVVSFLGKYISIENNLKFEGRYIFNSKAADPNKVFDQPNDIEDLEKVYEEETFEIYAPRKDYNEVLGSKFLSLFKEIKVEEPLLNLIVVVWEGHSAAYLSYDDSVTTLPFEHPFTTGPIEKYRSDLIKTLELLERI